MDDAGVTGTIGRDQRAHRDRDGSLRRGDSAGSVTLTSTDTNQSRTATTGTDGSYRFTLLPPGTYRVRFSATGFKTAEVSTVTLNVTETPVLDRSLEIGAQTEQVTVEATAVLLQTADSTLGRVVDGATLSNQPMATRNYTGIMGLEAGASGNVGNATALGKATADMAVNGAGLDQNNIQMDGATIVNAFGAGNNADSGIYVGVPITNPDAIQEFKVQTSTYDASYGRNPGANVNIITRSGSNTLHGSLFEFLRNEDLNANSFFGSVATFDRLTEPGRRWVGGAGLLSWPGRRSFQ